MAQFYPLLSHIPAAKNGCRLGAETASWSGNLPRPKIKGLPAQRKTDGSPSNDSSQLAFRAHFPCLALTGDPARLILAAQIMGCHKADSGKRELDPSHVLSKLVSSDLRDIVGTLRTKRGIGSPINRCILSHRGLLYCDQAMAGI